MILDRSNDDDEADDVYIDVFLLLYLLLCFPLWKHDAVDSLDAILLSYFKVLMCKNVP